MTIEEKILDYLGEEKQLLEILDDDTPDRGEDKDEYYSVTAPYIYKYVLHEEYDYEIVVTTLINMVLDGIISSFVCTDIKKLVFLGKIECHPKPFRYEEGKFLHKLRDEEVSNKKMLDVLKYYQHEISV